MKFKIILSKLKNKILFLLNFKRRSEFKILNSHDSVGYIIKNKCSLARFGDGELGMVKLYLYPECNFILPAFQNFNREMGKRLYEILNQGDIHNCNLFIGLPYCMINNVPEMNKKAKYFWQFFSNKNIDWISSIANKNNLYLDTQISRFYMDYSNKTWCEDYFNKLKKTWSNRNILIIEGEQTRLGVGNDIFNNVISTRRILAPAINAFSKYPEILASGLKHASKDDLVILALGMTATILASDFAERGLQAIDLGHIDIEYEWMIRKASDKIAIPGKYTNEAKDGRNPSENIDSQYQSEIVEIIK